MPINLDTLEALYTSQKFTLGSVPDTVLELIAELRQVKAERDWLAENMPNSYPECHCPEGHYKPDCNPTPTAGGKVCYECLLCWLEAAKEAICQKN